MRLTSEAATVNATWNSATDVPVSASSYLATGNTVSFTLNFAPVTGTSLTVVNNTGLPFINGTFDNLNQGQMVTLSYGGMDYHFIAHYFSGTGNDLALVWAGRRAVVWGYNNAGQLGNSTDNYNYEPGDMTVSKTPLAGRTILAMAAGWKHSLALCSDNSMVSCGYNGNDQLGNGTNTNSIKPVAVTTAGTPLAGKILAAISTGYQHNLALCSDGTLASWGWNAYGQLGTGDNLNYASPKAVTTAGTSLAGKTVVAISAGGYHNLALCSDGTLHGWGDNFYGELGTVSNHLVPGAVTIAGTPLQGRMVKTIAAGGGHSLALCSDGTLVAWGNNDSGQLGNNSNVISSVPVAVTIAGTALAGKTVVALAAGWYHNVALCSDGTVVSWGKNGNGQLGNNSTTDSRVPVAVTTAGTVLAGKTVVAVAAGNYHSMALCSDGTTATWGYSVYGQLGNNDTAPSNVPVAISTSVIGAGERFILAVSGQSAYHNLALVAEPVPAATTLAATSVSGSTAFLNGRVNANSGTTVVSFEYGLDTSYGTNVPASPATITGSVDTSVRASLTGLMPATTYHFRINAALFGEPAYGADQTFTTANTYLSGLALGTSSLSPAFSPTVYGYFATVSSELSSITVTPTTADSNATVSVNGIPVSSGSASSPVPLAQGNNTLYVVVTGADHVSTQTYSIILLKPAASALTAYYASGGEVPASGNGFTAAGLSVNFALNYAPAPGTTLTVVNNTGLGFIKGAFSNLSQGQIVSLDYNGVSYNFVANYYGGSGNDLVLVWAGLRPVAWGDDGYFQLGSYFGHDYLVPVPVTTDISALKNRTVLALSAGNTHSLALCSDGSMASWGDGRYDQLGYAIMTSPFPVPVTTAGTPLDGKAVIAISSGFEHNLALAADGTLVSWGYNFYGQLGNNSTTIQSFPGAVTTSGTSLDGKSVAAIRAGKYHSVVLCLDGTVSTWGYNIAGQLGNNSTTDSSTPVAVTTTGTALSGKTVVAVAAGAYHVLALCADGTLVAWGENTRGQLGNGTTINSSVPIAVTTSGTVLEGKTIVALAAGERFNLVRCSDGTLASWGYNVYGQLGNNSTSQSSVPVAVAITDTALAGKTVVGISAGYYHAVATCSDGTIATWGYNNYGQLGNNSTSNSGAPVAVNAGILAPGETFMLAASGQTANHNLVLVATPAPAATTQRVTTVSGTAAMLNAVINANGGSAAASFDYGLDNTYGMNLVATPSSVTGSISTPVSVALTGLAPATTYHYRVLANGRSGTANGVDLIFTTLSLQQDWRQQNFGTIDNTGTTADTADYDGDGICNLLEYALNLDPKTAGKLPVGTAVNGANLEYAYTRSTAAVNAGTSFAVEWNGALSGAWSSSGVTQTVLSDDGTTQQVKAVIPMNAASKMFVHLSVTAPP